MTEIDDMSRTTFAISYDGIGLEAHTINVAHLAPALLSLSSLFTEANKIINGEQTIVQLRIKATVPGSFETILQLSHLSTYKEILSFFNTDSVNALINLMALITGASGACIGLFKFIKWLGGRTPEQIITQADGKEKVYLKNENIEISSELRRLYENPLINIHLQGVLAPLKTEDIDSFKVKGFDKEGTVVTVTKEEAEYFDIIPFDSEARIIKNEIEQVYNIVSPVFKKANKWRLSDGQSIINVIINDENFLEKVDNSEIAFSSGDMLRCRIQLSQIYSGNTGKIKHEYEVIEVLEHIKKPEQLKFDLKPKDKKHI